jgi:hypothetical protein
LFFYLPPDLIALLKLLFLDILFCTKIYFILVFISTISTPKLSFQLITAVRLYVLSLCIFIAGVPQELFIIPKLIKAIGFVKYIYTETK